MTSKQKLKQLLNTPELMQLLQNEQWDELMDKLPIQTRPVLLELLRDCGVEETEVTRLQLKYGIMYGLKHTSSTITIGAPDKNGIHNIGNVSNQGMQGGRQLGFMTPADAEHIANQIGNPHVYTMQPKTVVNYNWVKVDTIYGPAYAALEAIGKFKNLDPDLKQKSQKLQSLRNKIATCKGAIEDEPKYYPGFREKVVEYNLKLLHPIIDAFCKNEIITVLDSATNLKQELEHSTKWSRPYVRITIEEYQNRALHDYLIEFNKQYVYPVAKNHDCKITFGFNSYKENIDTVELYMHEYALDTPDIQAWMSQEREKIQKQIEELNNEVQKIINS